MKIRVLLFYIFIFFLCCSENVLASTYYDASTNSYGVQGCQSHWRYCWRNSGTAFELQGVRISAYNENGEKISDTVDFTNNLNAIEKINNSRYYMSNNLKNRIEYIDDPSVSRSISTPSIKHLNFKSFIQTGLTTSNSIQEIFGAVEDNIKSSINLCQGSYSSRCSGNKYLVIEPLTIIWSRFEDYDYYGTYYELTYMIENYGYKFQKGNGVSPFLPGNIAMSLYITDQTNTFSNFYKNTGLVTIDVNDVTTISKYINNYYHDYLKNKTVGYFNVAQGYGIGVMKTDFQDPPKQEGCVGETCAIPECTVTKPQYDICDASGVIQYEYTTCPLRDNTYGEYIAKYDSEAVCQIQCNEKYYIEAWSLNNQLNPVGEQGILAGTYIPISSPTVYHKKICEYYLAEGKLKELIRQDSYKEDCTGVSPGEPCPLVFDEDLYNAALSDYINDSKTGKCDELQKEFKTLSNNIASIAENDIVGDLTLTLFSDYTLSATKTQTILNTIDNKYYDYGYHNTFTYSIKGNVNKYINMLTVTDDNNDTASNTNVGDGIAKVTTPITIRKGEYSYSIKYYDVFSTNQHFTGIISNKYPISTQLDTTSCPYKIIQRNISNVCIPEANNNNCGNPDTTFRYPKIKIIYRPINLSYPFPGKDGVGRIPGLNWQSVVEIENGVETVTKDYIDKYITNNRGVVTEEVYSKEPLYVIKLDANKIKAIREYNKTHPYDDFELNCTEGTGTECTSKFLRDTSITEQLITDGKCKDVSIDNFYSCADK